MRRYQKELLAAVDCVCICLVIIALIINVKISRPHIDLADCLDLPIACLRRFHLDRGLVLCYYQGQLRYGAGPSVQVLVVAVVFLQLILQRLDAFPLELQLPLKFADHLQLFLLHLA